MGPRQEHFRMMALYNQWADGRLYAAAGRIAPGALAEDRGAFFGSLLGTLNHLLVTDRLWTSRLEGESPRGTRLDEVPHRDFDDLRAARRAQDQKLVDRRWCTNRVMGAERRRSLSVRRRAATLACRAGSSGRAPSSRPGLRSSAQAESGREGADR
jgi:uncharacterized damage-inducible protein DinB